MARTRSQDYDAKRQALLDGAARLFARQGFPRTSISEIAAACQASKSWLYHYFPSKEAILAAILAEHMELLSATAAAAMAGTTDPREQLRALMRAFMAIYAESAHTHIVVLNDLQHLPKADQRRIIAAERKLVTMVADLLEGLSPRLMAKRDLRKPVTMLLFGAINWTHTWYRPDGPVPPDALADLAVEIFLSGLTK